MTSSIADWVTVSRQLVSGFAEADQAKVFHLNAARIYGLG